MYNKNVRKKKISVEKAIMFSAIVFKNGTTDVKNAYIIDEFNL